MIPIVHLFFFEVARDNGKPHIVKLNHNTMAGVIKLNLDVSSLDNPNALLVGEMEKGIEKFPLMCLV